MKISVVIPSFNRAGFVGRTIESVLTQTRLPDEILVVDDGSSDNTQSVVAEFSRIGARVRYLWRENGGLSAARNTGVANAAPDTDALLFLDSDDLLEPTALAKLDLALAASPDAVLAFCRARYINADDAPLIVPNTALCDEPEGGDMWNHLLHGNCVRSAGGVLIRRAALDAERFDETLRSNEDWDLWLRLAETGKPFVRVPEPLLLYRIHGGNMSANRAVMHQTALHVYEKTETRHIGNADKLARIHAGRAEYERRDTFTQNEAVQYVLQTEDAIDLPYDAAAVRKHQRLRALLTKTGIAALHRKTPLAWRLRLRALLGINPNA